MRSSAQNTPTSAHPRASGLHRREAPRLQKTVTILSIIIAPAVFAQHDVRTVRGEGSAAGIGSQARHEAVLNAKVALLIDHFEDWAKSPNLAWLAPVLDRSASYFQNVRVVNRSQTEDTTHVEIECDLLVGKLSQDVTRVVLPEMPRKPTVAIIIQDDFGDPEAVAMVKPGIAETAVEEILSDAGMQVVSGVRLRETMPAEKLAACVAGADALAAEAARQLLADVALVGRATVSMAEEGGAANMLRSRGSVALRLVRAADDHLVQEFHGVGKVDSRDTALGGPLAVTDACDRLSASIVSAVVVAVLYTPRDDAVRITLQGDIEDIEIEAVKLALSPLLQDSAPEVVAKSGGVVRLRLPYWGEMRDIVEILETTPFPGFRLTIQRVLGRDLAATIVRSGGGD